MNERRVNANMAVDERFQDRAQDYVAYLDTPEGRLRSDLTFANFQDFLPRLRAQSVDPDGRRARSAQNEQFLHYRSDCQRRTSQNLRVLSHLTPPGTLG